MSPGTEFARDFCAGIGPLQLGVVLVFFFFYCYVSKMHFFKDKRSKQLTIFILSHSG